MTPTASTPSPTTMTPTASTPAPTAKTCGHHCDELDEQLLMGNFDNTCSKCKDQSTANVETVRPGVPPSVWYPWHRTSCVADCNDPCGLESDCETYKRCLADCIV